MRKPSAKKLLQNAIATEDWDLAALIIVAGSLEALHMMQAHQPATLTERAKQLIESLSPASQELQPALQVVT